MTPPRTTPPPSWLNQRTWRTVGGVCIVIAAAMAWYGSENVSRAGSLVGFAIYWLIFLLLFLIAIYMVLLDLRYIRLQYLIAERDLYLDAVAAERRRLAAADADGTSPNDEARN